MQIGKISLHTSKAVKQTAEKNNAQSNNLTTNPFGVSFKGNVIQADVFESANKNTSQNIIAEKSKLFASAVVSGINSFNEAFKSRLNSAISFGKKFTKDIFDSIEKIGNTEINFDMDAIKNTIFPNRQYSVKQLSNRSVGELKDLWTSIAAQGI